MWSKTVALPRNTSSSARSRLTQIGKYVLVLRFASLLNSSQYPTFLAANRRKMKTWQSCNLYRAPGPCFEECTRVVLIRHASGTRSACHARIARYFRGSYGPDILLHFNLAVIWIGNHPRLVSGKGKRGGPDRPQGFGRTKRLLIYFNLAKPFPSA